MIREHVGGLIPCVRLSLSRYPRTRALRIWVVWFRVELTIEVAR